MKPPTHRISEQAAQASQLAPRTAGDLAGSAATRWTHRRQPRPREPRRASPAARARPREPGRASPAARARPREPGRGSPAARARPREPGRRCQTRARHGRPPEPVHYRRAQRVISHASHTAVRAASTGRTPRQAPFSKLPGNRSYRWRLHQSSIASNRATRWFGRPPRDRSWPSPGNSSISAGTPRSLSATNRRCACSTGQRQSCSE